MSLPRVNPTSTQAWQKLHAHFQEIKDVHLTKHFAEDPERAQKMSLEQGPIYLDYSKNRISNETLELLMELASEVGLESAIEAQFSGDIINETEGRAVLHTALRDFSNMKPEVTATLEKMKRLSEAIISGDWKGYTGKSITQVVNIGIGGSDLGPQMVVDCLRYYRNKLDVKFISNVEGDHGQEILKTLDPETTLFIVVSKSFTTQETLMNAKTARKWFLTHGSEGDIAKHFVAVSTNLDAVTQFGIASENILPMWDWVGGRFSLWSAVGLSICCAVGYANFEDLLHGAHEMDVHFRNSEFNKNMPVILAMLSVWYNNFYKAESEAVLPYTQYLDKLVSYLQQAVMESNGKHIDRNGERVNYETGTIVWGSTGTNAQHAFFQLMHQGTKLIPADFLLFAEGLYDEKEHQDALMANGLAQTEALMQGTFGEDVESPYKNFEGNNPTNTLLIQKLTPKNLGSVIALYEHKIFVQGIVWNIFSYDQWGVQLGKKLANSILDGIASGNNPSNPSTRELLSRFKR